MQKHAKIFVAGGETLIGAALVRRLRAQGFSNLCGTDASEPDLTDSAAVEQFFQQESPEYVVVAAGKSGGIAANQKYPADLIYDNLMVAANVIHAAWRHQTTRLMYLASSCSYPRLCPQPMRPESLMTGPLEPTNQAYAVAKIAGVELCQAFRRQYGSDMIVGIPANAFGPGDDFDPQDAHVCAALLRRIHEAKLNDQPSIAVWGTGKARREFIFADDLADACIFALQHYQGDEPLNLGGGQDVSIRELAEMIRDIVGYRGRLEFDATKPDGMPLKALDASRLAELGFRPQTSLRDALSATYDWYLHVEEPRTLNA